MTKNIKTNHKKKTPTAPSKNDSACDKKQHNQKDKKKEHVDVGETEPHEDDSILKKGQADLEEAKDKYIRLYAEFDNYRRRTAQEKIDMMKHANEQLVTALLPVIDDFERAKKSNHDDYSKSLEGFLLIQNKLQKALEQFDVKEMDTVMGSDFDPDIHEAVTKKAVTEDKLKGKVVDVLEKGYMLHDRVVRYAKIVIGN